MLAPFFRPDVVRPGFCSPVFFRPVFSPVVFRPVAFRPGCFRSFSFRPFFSPVFVFAWLFSPSASQSLPSSHPRASSARKCLPSSESRPCLSLATSPGAPAFPPQQRIPFPPVTLEPSLRRWDARGPNHNGESPCDSRDLNPNPNPRALTAADPKP